MRAASARSADGVGDGTPPEMLERLAYIMGTSACIMASTREPHFVPGVWGPYFSGMIPGLWLNEGGQSAAGAGIDHLMRSHPAHAEAAAAAKAEGLALLDFLERRVVERIGHPGRGGPPRRATRMCCRNSSATARRMRTRKRGP